MTAFSVVNAKVISDNTGASRSMRVLTSSLGVSRPLIDYCLSMHRSFSWQSKLLRAAKLFLEYAEVNSFNAKDETHLFRNFSNALYRGTIDLKTLTDPTGLYWHGIERGQVNYMITQLSDFFEWLEPSRGSPSGKFNPQYDGNFHDKQIDLQAYLYRRNKAFLGHSWSTKPIKKARRVRGEPVSKVYSTRPPMFPEDRFEELLFKGFNISGKYDYRGMLITLMLFGGGLRVCEPFHLFVADVKPHWDDPNKAFVAVHHPSHGSAPNRWENGYRQGKGSRQEYLAAEFGLSPRHQVTGKLHAGWKHPALDAKWYMQVHWFPEIYGQWFMKIWIQYMKQVASIPRNHPYAWINIDRQPLGGIYSVSQYQKALQAAVERIGLIFGKSYGTTAHGFRHAFAQRARTGDIDPLILQRLLHHCSLESQQVYTQPEAHEALIAIRSATAKLREANLQISLPNYFSDFHFDEI